MYLYGFTIQGIQNYIFNTNKLKEIIGASEIIERICTQLFPKHCPNFNDEHLLLNAAGNIRYIFSEKEDAESFFRDFPLVINKKAHGVPFSQSVIEIEENLEITDFHLKELDIKLRGSRNSPIILPETGIMGSEKSRRTGNVAVKGVINDGKLEFVDSITKLKDKNKDGNSLFAKLKFEPNQWAFTNELEEISSIEGKSWLAVVHADGNGMGEFIRTKILNSGGNITGKLKKFSKQINESTIDAFKDAFENTFTPDIVKNFKYKDEVPIPPLRPVILGGDDVTFIIRADLAIDFTRHYLMSFEKNTKNNLVELGDDKGLSACAGIAFTKEKFPFHYSVHLAEELCKYAKNKSERSVTSLQFHKIQDSFIESYSEIIKRELKAINLSFLNGPYSIGDNDLGLKKIDDLLKTVKLLKEENAPANGIRSWLEEIFKNEAHAKRTMARIEELKKWYYDALKIEDNPQAIVDMMTLHSIINKQ
jgi:hypothetical protein